MDFKKYSKELHRTRQLFQSNHAVAAKHNQVLKFVHGIWKRYSQAAEGGNSSFNIPVNMEMSIFQYMGVEEFVATIKEFSFDVQYVNGPEAVWGPHLYFRLHPSSKTNDIRG